MTVLEIAAQAYHDARKAGLTDAQCLQAEHDALIKASFIESVNEYLAIQAEEDKNGTT